MRVRLDYALLAMLQVLPIMGEDTVLLLFRLLRFILTFIVIKWIKEEPIL